MSRTRRKAYDGHTIRDGDHGKHCPSSNCDWCVRKPALPEREAIREQNEKRDKATIKRNPTR